MITNLFLSILEISMSVSLSVLILILLTPFLNQRYAAKWKYWIWLFLALRLVIPVNGTNVQAMADGLRQRIAREEAESGKEETGVPFNGMTLTRRVIVEIPEQMTVPIAAQPDRTGIRITVLDIVAVLWMAGSLFLLSVHLFIYLHYKNGLLKRGRVLKDRDLLRRIAKLKRELHIKRRVYVVESPEAASPMIIGLFQTVLILPEEEYREEELFFILKHELVHLKHKDLYFKLLFVVANALHWFNPFVWLMQKEAVVDMELYCDEGVIQGMNYAGRKEYTETLLATLHKQCVKRTVLSTQFYGGKKIMQRRFKNILSKKRKKNGFAILAGIILLTAGLGTLIGCSIVRESERGGTGRQGVEENQAGGNPTGDNPTGMENGQSEAEGNLPEEGGNVPGADSNLSEEATGQFAQMAGRWMIDFTVTDPSLWGSGISYGNEMEIAATGEFRYYIGIGVGGTGQCEEGNGAITVEIEPYEELLTEQEILILNYVNQDGDEYIMMDWHGEDVCWRRVDSIAADANNSASDGGRPAENAVLTFMLEGEEEQVPASLVTGEGYYFYLPDNEWQQIDSDTWSGLWNDQVQFRVTRQDGKTIEQIENELQSSGYANISDRIWRQDGEMIYGVELKVYENDVWGVYYSYPIDSEEGWGRRIFAIADTLVVTD